MKQGRTIQEVYSELERLESTKHDYVAPGATMRMENGKLVLSDGQDRFFPLTPLGHAQLAERAGLPKKYYDTLKTKHSDLLDYSVSYLLQAENERHLVRILDDQARAILSDRYRCLDHKPLLESVLPIFLRSGFQVVSSEITPTRFYLKVVSQDLQASFPIKARGGHTAVNELIRAGFWIQNSEVGHSRCTGGLFFDILRCTNGLMLSSEYGFAKNHSGKAIDFDDALTEYFSDKTRALDDATYWSKLKDVVQGMIGSPDGFKAAVERFRAAAEDQIEGNPVKVVEKVQEIFSLNNDEGAGVLKALIQGGDLSRWGVSNALTSYSQEVPDYDRATDFERIGGRVIELSSQEWRDISVAA